MGSIEKIPAWVSTVRHIQSVVGDLNDVAGMPEVRVSIKLFSSLGEYEIKPATAERKLRDLKEIYRNLYPERTKPWIDRKNYRWIFPQKFYAWMLGRVALWESEALAKAAMNGAV